MKKFILTAAIAALSFNVFAGVDNTFDVNLKIDATWEMAIEQSSVMLTKDTSNTYFATVNTGILASTVSPEYRLPFKVKYTNLFVEGERSHDKIKLSANLLGDSTNDGTLDKSSTVWEQDGPTTQFYTQSNLTSGEYRNLLKIRTENLDGKVVRADNYKGTVTMTIIPQ